MNILELNQATVCAFALEDVMSFIARITADPHIASHILHLYITYSSPPSCSQDSRHGRLEDTIDAYYSLSSSSATPWTRLALILLARSSHSADLRRKTAF
ncbi:hypothetical protein SCHPADRAFT_327172 [Schizopora paradoxa]|uniref:Uncharacterized protein n=1 Tax=Schizopora paradoxa TaxID=27342 RepID=A0A0H2RQR8_9AGAM|nr:hypothetical protein SCHPADRAFT_327172 [Schizopora paradoxa]